MEMPRPDAPTLDGHALRKFTRAEYDRMVELGVIGESEKVELIFGMLVAMTSDRSRSRGIDTPHLRDAARADRRRRDGDRGCRTIRTAAPVRLT